VKASLLNARLAALDSPQRRLTGLLNTQLTRQRLPLKEWEDQLAAITIADVQRVAKQVQLQATYCLHGGDQDVK